MIVIRHAAPADASAIAELAEQAGLFPADALPDMIAPYFDGTDDQFWSVAVDGTEVQGIVYCAAERFTEGTFNILAIAAAPGRERQGIGLQLIKELEADLSAAAARLLLVETSSDPRFEPTQRFYDALGFQKVATIPDYWAAGDDKIIFSKALDA